MYTERDVYVDRSLSITLYLQIYAHVYTHIRCSGSFPTRLAAARPMPRQLPQKPFLRPWNVLPLRQWRERPPPPPQTHMSAPTQTCTWQVCACVRVCVCACVRVCVCVHMSAPTQTCTWQGRTRGLAPVTAPPSQRAPYQHPVGPVKAVMLT